MDQSSTYVPEWKIEPGERCLIYSGAFAIFNSRGELLRKIQGRIVEWAGLPVDVYLYNPPAQLRRHPHGPCLQLLTPGTAWFKLHWQRAPRDFDTSRVFVEQMLHEALLES